MKNKTVIRKELKPGGFTSIHHSILNDTRLTPVAFKLITLILSDSDEKFDFSRTLYVKRLGVNEKTFDKALEILIQCGYIRKTPINVKNLLHYTISEYGNLNNIKEEPIQEVEEKLEDNYQDELNNILISYVDYIEYIKENDNENFNKIVYMVSKKVDINKIEKEILTIKYKEEVSKLTDIDKYPKAYKQMVGFLKDTIFNKKDIKYHSTSKWPTLKSKEKESKTKIDYETQMSDYYENPKD